MEVVHGPTSPAAAGITYQVTLASGMIVTNPESFGPVLVEAPLSAVIVTEGGRIFGRPDGTIQPPVGLDALSDSEIWRRVRAMPGWEEDAQRAREQAEAGQGISLEDLRSRRRR